VTSWLEQGDGVTNVKMQADIHLTGTVAQLSRGLLPEVSRKLTQQFADCLHRSMEAAEVTATESADIAAPAAASAEPPARAEPIGGIRLGLAAIWASIARFFRRLFGRRQA
jgi:hypothetical protein